MNISVVKADITTLKVDAIQNAANGILAHGAGVAGAIGRAGGRQLDNESRGTIAMFGMLPAGAAVWTSAGEMQPRISYVIHAVTMEFPGGCASRGTVGKATVNSLRIADALRCRSFAMCALGTGIGGLALDECAEAMLASLEAEKLAYLETVVFCAFDDKAEAAFGDALVRQRGKVGVTRDSIRSEG